MARHLTPSILIIVLCGLALEGFAKPLETVAISEPSDENASLVREARSPQFGFFNNDYNDYSDIRPRHLKHKHKPKPTYTPIVIQGGHQQGGCRSHGCGSYNKPNSGGSTFAGAFAGSSNGGSNTHSNAEAAAINFGPISLSYATASSGRKYGNQGYGDYGNYGGYGGFDY
ncbi:5'-3' exoribonuclease 2 [Neodiprion lecontei]|uniref:5'-3' exoribonuclease 2 n=1 Tax=Neodiprion lecontei TaxID=441921 RepID=A0A6J0BVN3_NEOLC|nr:5'-3' exoribonuclease 2 [Neodiprion lecontei]XP_046412415.1 5'-3' exoribonuclease 2-like [Neodiprion fabricii]